MMRGQARNRRGVRALVWMVMFGSSLHGQPLLAHEMGTIRLSAPQVVVGGSLTLTGSKFTKDAPLTLELRGALATLQLGAVRTDGEGAFTHTLILPAQARAGAYSLVVIADDGDVVARVGLPVLAAAAASDAHAAVGHSPEGMAQGQGTAEMMTLPAGRNSSQSALVLSILALCVIGGSLMVRNARLAEGDEGGRRGVRKHLAGGLVVLALAGLSNARRPDVAGIPIAQAVPQDSAAAPAHDMGTMPLAGSAPAGSPAMDHAGMPGMEPSATAATTGSMDHTGMVGMTSPGTGATAATDHSGMPGMQPTGRTPRSSSPPVDHSTMPGMQSPSGESRTVDQRSTPAMDHSAMAGMGGQTETVASADLATTEKLRRLAALLVGDSAVQERIQADSALRSGWQDEGVKGLLAPR